MYKDSNVTATPVYAKDKPLQPAVSALHDLAEATRELALASDAFLEARDRQHAARARFEQCRDIVAKETESIALP